VGTILSPEYSWVWSAALGVALYFPVRHLIWVLTVRRQQRQLGGRLPDAEAQDAMKRRAGVTAALLCLIFAATYGGVMFGGRP
jgi:hypothetical protein